MRLKPMWIAVLLGSCLASRETLACSQCMCGTPFPADVLGGVVPMQFSWGGEERYLSKSNALDAGPGLEEEREHRLAAFALWRPADRLALVGRLPYALKEITTHPQGEASSVANSHGLGDAEVLAMVGALQTAGPHPLTVGLVAGVAAPTGANDLKDKNGDRLDAHLQAGTGAWAGTSGVNVTVSATGGTWEGSLPGRVNGTNAHGYRYGSVFLYNAGFTTRSRNGLRLLMQVNGRSAAHDRLEDTTIGENTGGTVLYAAPGARWASTLGVNVEAAVQIPIAQALCGVQTEHTTARLSLSMSR